MSTENPFSLQDKVVILTGAAGYLGCSYTKSLLGAGAFVAGFDMDKEGLKRLRGSLERDEQVRFAGSFVDLRDQESVSRAVATVVQRWGTVDGLINNAAMNPAVGSVESAQQFAPYENYDINLFRREIDANLTTMLVVSQPVLKIMLASGSGSIVNIASEVSTIAHDHRVYAEDGKHKSLAYVASKTAVLGFTRQLASRYGSFGVRVNALSIGGVYREGMPEEFVNRFAATNMMGRMAKLGEYGPTIVYLLSAASSFMTGSNIIIDGGKSAW